MRIGRDDRDARHHIGGYEDSLHAREEEASFCLPRAAPTPSWKHAIFGTEDPHFCLEAWLVLVEGKNTDFLLFRDRRGIMDEKRTPLLYSLPPDFTLLWLAARTERRKHYPIT